MVLPHRYCNVLAEAHDPEHLCKFEELVEAAVDLDKVPDEYLIAPGYREDLQVSNHVLLPVLKGGPARQCPGPIYLHLGSGLGFRVGCAMPEASRLKTELLGAGHGGKSC